MQKIAIIGKPNSGKSLLFNSLTGLNQKVTNYPGITVNIKCGKFRSSELIDFPGMYSFKSVNRDESIAVTKFTGFLERKEISLVLCVLDATNLKASLTIGLDIQKKANAEGVATVFALNMMDEVNNNNLTIDVKQLSEQLNTIIFPISAKTGLGLEKLKNFIEAKNFTFSLPQNSLSQSSYDVAQKLSAEYGIKSDILFLKQVKIDKFFLSPVLGIVSFALIMLVFISSDLYLVSAVYGFY